MAEESFQDRTEEPTPYATECTESTENTRSKIRVVFLCVLCGLCGWGSKRKTGRLFSSHSLKYWIALWTSA